jgi:hypothetical protein
MVAAMLTETMRAMMALKGKAGARILTQTALVETVSEKVDLKKS